MPNLRFGTLSSSFRRNAAQRFYHAAKFTLDGPFSNSLPPPAGAGRGVRGQMRQFAAPPTSPSPARSRRGPSPGSSPGQALSPRKRAGRADLG